MSINNLPKPGASSITNLDRVTSTLSNASKPTFTPLWSTAVLPWQLDLPWQRFGEISNQSKPA